MTVTALPPSPDVEHLSERVRVVEDALAAVVLYLRGLGVDVEEILGLTIEGED